MTMISGAHIHLPFQVILWPAWSALALCLAVRSLYLFHPVILQGTESPGSSIENAALVLQFHSGAVPLEGIIAEDEILAQSGKRRAVSEVSGRRRTRVARKFSADERFSLDTRLAWIVNGLTGIQGQKPNKRLGAVRGHNENFDSWGRSMTLRMIVLAALAAGLMVVGTRAEAASHVSLDAKPTPAQTAAVKLAFGADFADMAPFLVGQADLNGDGRPDLIIVSQNPMNCGSHGCNVFALLATANGYADKGIDLNFIFGGEYILILDTVHNGMHDFRGDNGSHVFVWDGKQYQ
jgi:hypothetical protein